MERWRGRRGFIPGYKILDGVFFVVHNPLLTICLIFLTLLLIMCLKLSKYDCIAIIRRKKM
jgi:hypothetical protein